MKQILSNKDASLLRLNNVTRFGGGSYVAADTIRHSGKAKIEMLSRHPGNTLMSMGAYSYCVSNAQQIFQLKLGRFCSIARDVDVYHGIHPLAWASTSPFSYAPFFRNLDNDFRYEGADPGFHDSYGDVTAGSDVWIGAFAKLKGGISIGHGAVVAACSNVVKDVPPYAIVGGNPAKTIRMRFDEHIVERMLTVQWWNLNITHLRKQKFSNVEQFLAMCEKAKSEGSASKYSSLHIDENGVKAG